MNILTSKIWTAIQWSKILALFWNKMRQFTKGIKFFVTGNPNSLLLGKIRLYIFHPQTNWDVECGVNPCFTQTITECVHVTNPILLTTCRDTNRAFRYNTFCLRKFNRGNNQNDEHVNITFHFRKRFTNICFIRYIQLSDIFNNISQLFSPLLLINEYHLYVNLLLGSLIFCRKQCNFLSLVFQMIVAYLLFASLFNKLQKVEKNFTSKIWSSIAISIWIICILKWQCIAYITKSTFVLCISLLSI